MAIDGSPEEGSGLQEGNGRQTNDGMSLEWAIVRTIVQIKLIKLIRRVFIYLLYDRDFYLIAFYTHISSFLSIWMKLNGKRTRKKDAMQLRWIW
jgi:hypothetical protein